MSAINTGSINVNYPIPGVNNSSQGFRDNFSGIKNNLDTAGSEISDLQNNAIVKGALSGIPLNNDMNNTLISNALTQNFRQTTYNLGNNLTGIVNLDLSKGDVQYGTVTDNIALSFSKWAPAGTYSSVQLILIVNSPEIQISFPSSVTIGVSTLENFVTTETGGYVTILGSLGLDSPSVLHFMFSTKDCGTTIEVVPVNRPRKATQLTTNVPTTLKGQQGDMIGQIACDSSYMYLCIADYTDGVDDIWTQISSTAGTATGINYTAAGSTYTRTVESKLNDSVSLVDFGADPTGVSDSTTAIQDAMNYVGSVGGGTVTSPPGATYKITSSIILVSSVILDLNGSTIVQHTDNIPVITAPTMVDTVNWGIRNVTLSFNEVQDGTSTVTVTGSTLLPGDIFQDQTTGGLGQVVSVVGSLLTYKAGPGTIGSGHTLSVNSVSRAATVGAGTNLKCGVGIRLAYKAFSYQYNIDTVDIQLAYDGIVCPPDYQIIGPTRFSSFAFVGRIQDFTANVSRWAINYDCDSAVGGNTNVQLVNCWHLHSYEPRAPFASGFAFNACSQFQWQSMLADKITGQFLFIQSSSGWLGDLSLEAAEINCVPNNSTAAVLFSDSSLSVQTLKFIGNTFNTYNNITVASDSLLNVNDIIVGASSGATGKIVAKFNNTVTFIQYTSTGFSAAENVQVGGVTKTTVSIATSNSGAIYLFRGTASSYNVPFTAVMDNYVTSYNTYAGQGIYDVVPTTNTLSPAAGYYWVYNTQASIDRYTITVNATGSILVGDTIVGATSLAQGKVASISGSGVTTIVTYSSRGGVFQIGENITVSAVVKGSVTVAPAVAPNLADFAATKSIRLWNGDNRYYTTGMMADNYSTPLGTGSWNFTNPNSSEYAKDLVGTVLPYGASQAGGITLQSWDGTTNYPFKTKLQLRTDAGAVPRLSIVGPDNGNATVEIVTQDGASVETVRGKLTDGNGNFVWGTAPLATSATDGFVWIPSCAGSPTGAPTSPYSNAAALVVDTTNSRLYIRVGSTWKYATLT